MTGTPDTPATAERYDNRTAMVVVDVQNDFAHPDGNLYVSGGDEAIATINREIEAALQADSLIVYTQDWHPPVTPHFEKDGGTWPTHCVQHTWGAELHPTLRVVEGPVIRKGTEGEDGYSAFSVRDPESGTEASTELESLLRDRNIDRVVVTGLAQDVCVMETILDARRLGFETILVRDATRPVELNSGDGERALSAITAAGAVVR